MGKRKPTITRRGVRISPRANRVRIIVYMILIPLLTWYGHQKYTNPFKYHPNMVIYQGSKGPAISLFETTFRDTVNRYTLSQDFESEFSVDSAIGVIGFAPRGFLTRETKQYVKELHLTNLQGRVNDSVVVMNYHDWKIVIPLTRRLALHRHTKADVLVAYDFTQDELMEWRQMCTPRMTLWVNGDSSGLLPENVIVWNSDDEMMQVKEGRYSTLITEYVPKTEN